MKRDGKTMIMTKVLDPLLEVVYDYKRSQYYNCEPNGEDADAGWQYYEDKFYEILRGLNENLYLSDYEYHQFKAIILEMKAFVTKFSGVEGLPERYFELNPNLRFYRVAFTIQKESDDAFYKAVTNNLLNYVPSIKDFADKDVYFEEMRKISLDNNYKQEDDDFFMEELALALRRAFSSELEL